MLDKFNEGSTTIYRTFQLSSSLPTTHAHVPKRTRRFEGNINTQKMNVLATLNPEIFTESVFKTVVNSGNI